MIRKAERRGRPPIKLEKKTKIIEKGELDTIFGKDQEKSKKNELLQQKSIHNSKIKTQTSNSNKPEQNQVKKESNINMFTEGLSYEKIDHDKYNKALSNFNFLFTKDLNKNNQKKIEKPEKKGQNSKKYLFERALYKGIEIEIKLNKDNKLNNKSIEENMVLLNNFIINENNFIYYEYSNSRNISFNKLSDGDMLSYRYFYKSYDNINFDNNLFSNKEEYIKQFDYVNTLNNLFFKYNTNKKLFFIITPLYAFSFDYNKNIPLLITSSKNLEVQLNNNDIKIIHIKRKAKPEKQNKNITNNKNIIQKDNNNENKIISDNIDKSEDEEDELNNTNVPIGISKLYVGLFFNYFVNQDVLKPFNIFSNFEFEGCIFRKCKAHLIKTKKNGDNINYDSIIIKIEGIIFEENIQKMNEFLQNKLKANNYTMRLNKIRSTSNFYKENKEIESYFERFEYKDNNYYFYK